LSRRPYRRPVEKRSWYLKQRQYRAYMLREATCLIVAVYCVLLLMAFSALGSGDPAEWSAFLESQRSPAWAVFHALSLLYFVAFQTVPWFRLAPKAMPLAVNGKPVLPGAIVAGHYLGWIVVTVVFFLLTGVI
jgi:fumarate reductase subunit C